MNISLKPLIGVLLFIAIFAGFQGGRYFMSNRLQEVGILASLLVFVLGAWVCLFRLDQRQWKAWVYTPCLLIGGIMVVWGATFAIKFGGNVAFNLFASREFLLGFIGPAVYLIVRAGFSLEWVTRIIWLAFIALMLTYLFFYSTMNLREAFFSPDHTVSNLVTYDEWRGFRLKPPLFAIMLSLLASFMLIVQARSILSILFAVLVVALSSTIWSIVLFRSTLATMILSVLLYPILFSHENRKHIIMLALPCIAIAIPIGVPIVVDSFLNAEGGAVRAHSFATALKAIPDHLILGVGEDSAYGTSYQDLFGKMFYPSDLGVIGMTLKYGVVGISLYLYMHFFVWGRLLTTHWMWRKQHGSQNPILWAMLMFMTAQTFNLMLNPGLAYAQGITAAALSLALCGLARDSYPLSEPLRHEQKSDEHSMNVVNKATAQ